MRDNERPYNYCMQRSIMLIRVSTSSSVAEYVACHLCIRVNTFLCFVLIFSVMLSSAEI